MANTKEGGKKTRDTNIKKYGENWYSKIGALGGKAKGKPKGFAAMTPKKLKRISSLGGQNRHKNVY